MHPSIFRVDSLRLSVLTGDQGMDDGLAPCDRIDRRILARVGNDPAILRRHGIRSEDAYACRFAQFKGCLQGLAIRLYRRSNFLGVDVRFNRHSLHAYRLNNYDSFIFGLHPVTHRFVL